MKHRHKKRKRGFPPLRYGKLSIAFVALFFLGSFLFFYQQVNVSSYFPIRTVQIYGATHTSQSEVKTLVVPYLKEGFFKVNIDNIRERLSLLPWVVDVYVRRSWPDSIIITLLEKEALAKWNHEGLMTKEGEFFSPPLVSYPENLPDLSGPNGKQEIVIDYFNEINRLFAPLHANISSLELSAYYTWTVTLDNGITLRLGHNDVLSRLKAFIKVYPKIIGERSKDVEYIDLRYANGMAVRWRAPVKL